MSFVNGFVESLARTGKSIKVGGEWYGAFSPASLGGCKVGDNVTFAWAPSKDGQYKNIKGSVSVVGGGAATPASLDAPAPRAAAPAASYGRAIAFPLPPLDGQRVIVRQNALGHSTKVVMEQGGAWTAGVSDAEISDRIINLARQFEAYVAGDLDLELAKED